MAQGHRFQVETWQLLRRASLCSAVLLIGLCSITLYSGVSQQTFEWASQPDVYRDGLEQSASWLRLLIAGDDVFIVAYVTTTVGLASVLSEQPTYFTVLIAVGGVTAGVLDFVENHQLLSFLRMAELGVAPSPTEIVNRSTMSQLKWLIGHATFVLVGFHLPQRDTVERLFRASLIYVQLPVGAATWCVVNPEIQSVLVWIRYASFVAGFVLIAWLTRRRLNRDK